MDNAKEIFLRAIEIESEDERLRYVEEACGSNIVLQRKVCKLLDEHFAPDSRFSKPAARFAYTATADGTNGGSHLSDSSSHHGRFLPGTKLADRYRIVSLLGRGGMGEVYRADDLRLGQTVALKFLPPELAKDAKRLEYFHREVRLARQISHPNICRVYDIGEVDGQHFISMEYIDGEDLKTLLHRIGRLPKDKGVQIAQQLCSGLAAAHARGVLHRDLKPANIMIDGRGQARITDFGLATAPTNGENVVGMSGTPAYMAPEQLLRGESSVQSDLYSLGLVLFELFTGQSAHQASTVDELRDLHRDSSKPSNPSSVVDDLDPAIERAVMWCLSPDVHDRPSSAHEVASAFPGEGPLQAALTRGELPPPELLAQASIGTVLSARVAYVLFAAVIVMLLLWGAVSDSFFQMNRIGPTKPPIVLADRAKDLLRHLGCEPGIDSAYGLRVLGRSSTENREEDDGYRFWYRESPVILGTANYRWDGRFPLFGRPSERYPEWNQPGMQGVRFDSAGRLTWFRSIPVRSIQLELAPKEIDWNRWLPEHKIGFSLSSLSPSSALVPPPDAYDHVQAWTGDIGQKSVFVQAAAWRGMLTYFEVFPASILNRSPSSDVSPSRTPWSHDFVFWFMFVGITVSIVIAVRNLRNGIADRDAALKGAAIIVTLNMVTWLLLADHQFNAHEYVYLISGLETALACALEQWILYVALEPIIRRRFPQVLSSWKRLLAGRMWDPLVGRDVLAGVVTGIALRSAEAISYLSDVTGSIPTQSLQQTLTIRETLACISYGTYSAMYMSLVLFVLAKLSSRVLRHPIAGYLVMGAFLFMLTWSIISPKYQHSPALGIALFATAFVASIVCLRLGLLTTVAMALTWIFATITPVTMKVDSFYFESGLVGVAGILGLASYATYVSQLGYRR